jgi:hypothetical protein
MLLRFLYNRTAGIAIAGSLGRLPRMLDRAGGDAVSGTCPARRSSSVCVDGVFDGRDHKEHINGLKAASLFADCRRPAKSEVGLAHCPRAQAAGLTACACAPSSVGGRGYPPRPRAGVALRQCGARQPRPDDLGSMLVCTRELTFHFGSRRATSNHCPV